MILSMKPLSLAEVRSRIESSEEKHPLHDYLKAYCKLSLEKARSLEEQIKGLNSIKIKEEHIVKIVDLLPRDAEEIHKIFNDVSLDESEVNAILNVVKDY